MSRAMGLGLVGVGGFGAFCIGAYEAMEQVAVVALADVDDARARKAAPPGARVYADYAQLLADPAVEVVAINTPPHLHGPMARRAAEAGKHVFVEKPLATSREAAEAAIAAARRAGVCLSVNFVLRQHPLHRLAAEVIHSEALGAFHHGSLENFAADDDLLPGHWFWDPEISGGIHVEHGVHFFDLCNHLVGAAPTEVTGSAQQRPDGRPDRVSATVRYGDRVLATFYHSFNQIRRFEETTIRLRCTRGHVVIEGWIPTALTLRGWVTEAELESLRRILRSELHIVERFQGGNGTFAHGGTTDRLAASVAARVEAPDRQGEYRRAIQAGMRDLVDAIREGRSPEVTAEDGLLSLRIALAASESSRHLSRLDTEQNAGKTSALT